MTNEALDEANAALLFELDEKIEERLKAAIQKQVVNGNQGVDVACMVGRTLLNNPGFMQALTEEVLRVAHNRFNPSVSTFGRNAYF